MNDREQLLLEIMHLMAEKFKDRIVLEGGMLLRLQGSHRSTQDIDYVLLSYESKKVLSGEIRRVLEGLEYLEIEDVQLNSRGIFITANHRDTPALRAVLEISVVPVLHMPPEHRSTVSLSNKYALGGRVISTMALPEAFANKIAAALERDTIRDLYDISQLEGLCPFDEGTLSDRLAHLSIGRGKPKRMNVQDAAAIIERKARALTDDAIKKELAPLLPPDQSEGILMIIKASLIRVAKRMAALT